MSPVTCMHCMSTPLPPGKDPRGDRISPFPAKSMNGLTPEDDNGPLSKTKQVGDDLMLTALWLINDDDDEYSTQ